MQILFFQKKPSFLNEKLIPVNFFLKLFAVSEESLRKEAPFSLHSYSVLFRGKILLGLVHILLPS